MARFCPKQSHHETEFTNVHDRRKRAIRRLWKRNERFYAQLTVSDPVTGKNRVQRISLLDKQGKPVGSVAQAVAAPWRHCRLSGVIPDWMRKSGARENLRAYLHGLKAKG